MTDDAFQSVFVPILKVLRGSLGDLVVIGGWVPELHRRLGDSGEWAVKPLGTTEVDLLVDHAEGSGKAHQDLAEALIGAGFTPVAVEGASAVWERDTKVGERVEFFIDHVGPWRSVSTVQTLEQSSRLGGLLLIGLGVLRQNSVTLSLPLGETAGTPAVAPLRVPELGAFLIHKGAIFHRRPDLPKKVKDLQYIIDVMQSGEQQIEKVERQIIRYCSEKGPAAEVARQARNHLGVPINEKADAGLRNGLARSLSVRHGITEGEGDARARGFLSDFIGLIPGSCGGIK